MRSHRVCTVLIFLYSFIEVCVYLWNHHSNRDNIYFIPLNFLVAPCNPSPPPHQLQATTYLFPIITDYCMYQQFMSFIAEQYFIVDTPQFVYPFPLLMDMRVLSCFWLSYIILLWTSVCKSLGEHKSLFLLSKN